MTAYQARRLARDLFLKTLPHLNIGEKLREAVELRDGVLRAAGAQFPLSPRRPVRVISIGKAAVEMAHAVTDLMAGVEVRGVVAAANKPLDSAAGLDYFSGGHPYPNEESWQAAEAALAMLERGNLTADDLVLFLISGGGSAMLERPLDPAVTLEHLIEFYRVLVNCGASIGEINTLRKHFSRVKAGRLAQAAWPARQLTLYVSDVPDHQPSMIASGPTMPDESTIADCTELLHRPGLREKLHNFQSSFEFADQYYEPTPKPGERWFERSHYHCLLSSATAVAEIARLAGRGGIVVKTDCTCDDWPLQKAADHLLGKLTELRKDHPTELVVIVSGGELSCPVTGNGIGGRNQAFVLDCAQKIAGERIIVLSAGTDGIDGNSPAAGAVADGETIGRAQAFGMEAANYQAHSDSFHFFEKLGDTIITGPTGTNVRDLRLLLAY